MFASSSSLLLAESDCWMGYSSKKSFLNSTDTSISFNNSVQDFLVKPLIVQKSWFPRYFNHLLFLVFFYAFWKIFTRLPLDHVQTCDKQCNLHILFRVQIFNQCSCALIARGIIHKQSNIRYVQFIKFPNQNLFCVHTGFIFKTLGCVLYHLLLFWLLCMLFWPFPSCRGQELFHTYVWLRSHLQRVTIS